MNFSKACPLKMKMSRLSFPLAQGNDLKGEASGIFQMSTKCDRLLAKMLSLKILHLILVSCSQSCVGVLCDETH